MSKNIKGITTLQALIIIMVIAIAAIGGIYYYYTFLAPKPVLEEVKVGLLWPMTGALALIGRDQVNAFSLVIEEVNAKGGIRSLGGARIRLFVGDTKGDPKVGAAEAERLITELKVHILVGAYQSAVTATCSEVAERYGIPFINPDSTSPGLTERGFKWFFRVTPHDGILVKNMVDFVKDLQTRTGESFKRIAILYENTLWGIDTAKVIREYAPTLGFEIVLELPYSAGATDVSSEVLKLKATPHDVLMQASYLSDAILFTKTFKELGYWPKLWVANDAGHIHPDYVKTLGKDADYVFSREVFCADLGAVKPAIKEANDKFRMRYGYDMDGTMARAYTAALLLVDVLERAASLKPEAIQKALKETNIPEEKTPMPWKGIQFDEKGQNIKGAGIIVQIIDGKSRTVWPFTIATTPYKWPVKAPWEG
ncbi:MAG: ABC transporter substrate-binding protein [Candidatus Methanomethylicia archaeon]